MLKNFKNKKECLLQVISLAVIVFFSAYRIFEKPGLWFADEFGYAGTAAHFAGMNWSEQIKNIPYYGMGYGLLLIPAYSFCNSAQQVIYYANILNLLMGLGAFELSIRFMKKIKNEECSIVIIYLCGVINSLYINNLVQLQLDWTEMLNLLLYWLVLCEIIELTEKNRTREYIWISILICFMIIVHMRNVGIVISVCIVLLIYLGKSKRVKINQVIIFSLIAIVGAIIFFGSKELIQNTVWNNSKTVAINDVGSSMENVKMAFSLTHISALIRSVLCKLFYAIASTYGIIVLGVLYAIRNVLSKEQSFIKKLILGYILLCFFVQLVIGSITSIYPARVDLVIYGRYFEHCIGSLICLGIYSISVENLKKIRSSFIYSVIGITFCALIAHEQISAFDSAFNVYPCISGVAKYFAKSPDVDVIILEIVTKVVLIIVVICVVYIFIKNLPKVIINKNKFVLLSPFIIVVYMWVNDGRVVVDYMLESEMKRYENINPISDSFAEYGITYTSDEYIYYLVGDDELWNEYLLGLQFNLGRNRLVNVSYIDWNEVIEKVPKFFVKKNAYGDNDIKEMDILFDGYLPIRATKEFILYKHKNL